MLDVSPWRKNVTEVATTTLIGANAEGVGINLLVELELRQLDHPLRQKRSVLCINAQRNLINVWQSQVALPFEQRKFFDHVIARLSFLHITVSARPGRRRNHAFILCPHVPKGFLLKEESNFQI